MWRSNLCGDSQPNKLEYIIMSQAFEIFIRNLDEVIAGIPVDDQRDFMCAFSMSLHVVRNCAFTAWHESQQHIEQP